MKPGHGVEQDVQRAEDLYRRAVALANWRASTAWRGCCGGERPRSPTGRPPTCCKSLPPWECPGPSICWGCATKPATGWRKSHGTPRTCITGAALQGHPEAMLRLGICYETGVGTEKDPAIAANLYRRAVEQGSDLARCRLGRLYEQGLGVERDLRRAEELYEAGTRAGVSGAKEALDRSGPRWPPRRSPAGG